MATTQNSRVVETTREARSGTTGHGVRYVLSFATVGVIALFAVVFLYYFA
jgi:hypothetical protein